MVRSRQVFQALVLEYSGTPTISVTVDGTAVLSGQALPTHASRLTRRILLPPEAIGYVAELQISGSDNIRHEFIAVPDAQFSQQQIFHYFDVSFTGSVKLKLVMDGVDKYSNNESENITLTVRKNRQQDTRRVYFPPLTYGYIPHLEQLSISSITGQVVSARPVALPTRFYKGLRHHGEVQVTFQGNVYLNMFLDGNLIEEYQFDESVANPDQYLTEKRYLPADTYGHVLQYIQYDGDGTIALLETDLTLADLEQPQVEAA